MGNVHWDLTKKTAVIRVLAPADYTFPYDAMLRDSSSHSTAASERPSLAGRLLTVTLVNDASRWGRRGRRNTPVSAGFLFVSSEPGWMYTD